MYDKDLSELNADQLRVLVAQERAYSRMLEIDQQHRVDEALNNTVLLQQRHTELCDTIADPKTHPLKEAALNVVAAYINDRVPTMVQKAIPDEYRAAVYFTNEARSIPPVHIAMDQASLSLRLIASVPNVFKTDLHCPIGSYVGGL